MLVTRFIKLQQSHWWPDVSKDTPVLINIDHIYDIYPGIDRGESVICFATLEVHVRADFDELCERIERMTGRH